MSILLRDKEILHLMGEWYKQHPDANSGMNWELREFVAKAQLKKVVEWLNEYDYGDAPSPIQVVNWIKKALIKEVE